MRCLVFPLLLLLAASCSREHATPPPPVKAAESQPAPAPAQPPPASTTAVNVDGEQLFQQNCATCHMANGSGVPYLQPAIRDSGWISAQDPQPLLSLILRGSTVLGEGANAYENDMPPFEHLTNEEIAALATRVRERFATAPAPPVTPAEVATARSRPGLP